MLDFSDMPDNDEMDMLPEGQYRAMVKETKAGTSGTGNDKVDLTFVITEEGPYEGWNQWYTITSSYKARHFTRRALVALGYEFDGLNSKGVIDLDQTIGNECILVVEHQQYTPDKGPNRGKTITSAKTVRLLPVDGVGLDQDEETAPSLPIAPTPTKTAKKKVQWKDLVPNG